MNTIYLVGKITNMDSRFSKGGVPILNFGMADNKTAKKTGVKQFYNCVLFGKGAEILCNYAKKGDTEAVSGKCEWQNYLKDDETRTVLKVIVSDFELCGEKRTENQKPMEEKEPFPKTAETEEIDF